MRERESETAALDGGIAIIGMACRYPDADTPEEFWRNLIAGHCSVRDYDETSLRAAGVSERELADPAYVRSGIPLAGFDAFDAEFFGVNPMEARVMDPQHRKFLECAWSALEDAGHTPASLDRNIGVFAGSGMHWYLLKNVMPHADLVEELGEFFIRHAANDKDFLATRASFHLDLRGPSLNVQTACSTSLVAVHLACQSLLNGECDMALAGGSTIEVPHNVGYRYREDGIRAADGRCRPLDADATGTMFGSGCGVVVLRRLADALADGDTVYAVIRGSATGNDGGRKSNYLAPSIEGQAQVIAEAIAVAGVDADSIAYVETPGTGTRIGDPIEVAALTEAFGTTARRQYCALGSVKANIGHLDTASGVAGLMKVALALHHRKLPASLHFRTPNPEIDWERSPFFVNASAAEWPKLGAPLRAGVSSLGVGGTNAHVILEEAPPQAESAGRADIEHVLLLSARTMPALDELVQRLCAYLDAHPQVPLADVAWTLRTGRVAFEHRIAVVATSVAQLLEHLRSTAPAVRADRSVPAVPAGASAAQAAALRWMHGLDVDWAACGQPSSGRRIPLPGYPFRRDRHWLEPPASGATGAAAMPMAAVPVGAGCEGTSRRPRPELSTVYVPPQTALESKLVSLWEDAFEIEGIGLHDDFFELGGNSLLFTRLLARLNRESQLALPADKAFAAPTIASLSALVATTEPGSGSSSMGAIPRLDRDRHRAATGAELSDEVFEFPAAFGQEQLWYLHELAPHSSAYNIAHAFELSGDLDADALDRAFAALVRRHDALRTGLRMVDEQLRQVVHAALPFALERTDLQALDEAARQAALESLRLDCARHRFDLAIAPLLYARLVTLEPQRHVLMFCIHHAIVDHIAELRLGEELSRLYAAELGGAPLPDDPARLQFPDSVVWQRARMGEQAVSEKLAFWQTELRDRHYTLDLPTDRPRPPAQSFAGEELAVSLTVAQSAHLRAHAQREQQSLFVELLSVLAVVLHKYSGHEDVVIGCPVANRPTEELQDVVGLFMNVVPIAVDVAPQQPFAQLARDVRARVDRARRNEDTPFEWIVKACQVPRSAAHNPLVQVWFTFQEPPMKLRLPGLEVISEPLHNGGSKLDLSFWFWDDGDRIHALVEYNTDVFEAASIRQLVERLERVVEQVTARPQLPVADISLLDADERAALAAAHEDATQVDVAPSMHGAFFALAEAQPERSVLVTRDGEWTAGQLARRADAIAAAIVAEGVLPGDVVGVCLPRDAQLVATLLGVLRCGAAYLPLDPGLPSERVAYMLEDSGARLVVACADTRALLPGDGVRVISVESIVTGDGAIAGVVHDARADDIAYMMYTSGSTGRPKGVRIPHGAVANFLAAMRERPGITADDALLAVTTYAFDISVLELFLPLGMGARVRLADRDETEDAAALISLIERERITLMQATPSTWRMLRAADWQGRAGLKALVGGEALSPELAKWLLPRVRELWNMYGPTETTVWSSCARIDADNVDACPIGTPIRRTLMQVVDEQLRVLPTGIPGEIVIGGAGVALGYHDRPELNAQRFVRLPESGGRVYRTGDLGVRRRDGQWHHLGRRDDQVKIRGYRIELGEIESVLAGVAEVDAIAVRDWRISEADHRLVAYYSVRPGQTIAPAQLRAHARRFLPEYMVPQHFIALEQLPLLPNGKINRGALPAPLAEEPAHAAGSPMPEVTPQEGLLLALWRELIGVDAIGLDDNFFDLGGHSLLAVTMAGRVEKLTGARLTLLKVATSNLRALASEIPEPAQAPAARGPGVAARLVHWLRFALVPRTLRRSSES